MSIAAKPGVKLEIPDGVVIENKVNTRDEVSSLLALQTGIGFFC